MSERWARSAEGCTITLARGAACRAAWHELELLGPDGEVDASVSATSYVVEADEPRPVAFLWNGGPGASSSPLHMQAFGPVLLEGETTVPNPDTLLDVADLVFIDPVGTGLSRAPRVEARARLLTVPGDADAVARYVRAWLGLHGRQGSRIHLVGESYGGARLAAAAPLLADLDLAGLVLISPSLDMSNTAEAPGNDLPAVFQLPTLAVAAWRHGKAGMGLQTIEEVWADAERFAVDELLPALFRGSAASDRAAVAQGVADRIGIDAATVLEHDLGVPSEIVLRTLRADEGLLVGRLDVRVTGPMPASNSEGRPPAADDPALGLGRSNVIHRPAIARHLREQVGVDCDDYVALDLDLNFAWDWRPADHAPPTFRFPLAQRLGEVLEARPEARVLLVGGYHDLATPLASTLHALRHSGVPDARWSLLALDAGHSIDVAVRGSAHDAIADLVSAGGGR